MSEYTISVSEGEVNLKHNIDRKYAKSHSNENIDLSRSHLNKTIIMDERLRNGMTIEQAFNDEFSDAVDEYNSKKKKSRDKIKNYYEKVNSMKASGHKMKAVHEIVLQIGNMENNGVVDGENVDALADILDTRIKQFQKDYPDIIFWYAVGHMDEATYHVHLAYSTPVQSSSSRGLSYKISQNECLEKMGISRGTATVKNKFGQDIERTRSLKEMFYDDMKDRIEEEMNSHGFTREIKDLHNKHLSSSNFKLKQRDTTLKQREDTVQQREQANETMSATLLKRKNKLENDLIAVYRDYDTKRLQVDNQLSALNTAKAQLRSMILSEDDTLKNKFIALHQEEFDKFVDKELNINTDIPEKLHNPEVKVKHRKKQPEQLEKPEKSVEVQKVEKVSNTSENTLKTAKKQREDDYMDEIPEEFRDDPRRAMQWLQNHMYDDVRNKRTQQANDLLTNMKRTTDDRQKM